MEHVWVDLQLLRLAYIPRLDKQILFPSYVQIASKGFAPGERSMSKAAPCVTNDFSGLIHFWEQNFYPAKCITALKRFIFGSKITEQIKQISSKFPRYAPRVY